MWALYAKESMSSSIQNACMKVARTNMWDNKPSDTSPMLEYQVQLTQIGIEALEHFKELGATEQDVADAIHYIDQVYAMPPIKDNVTWFKEVLFTILEPAFPNGGISDEATRFANRLIAGLKEQMA